MVRAVNPSFHADKETDKIPKSCVMLNIFLMNRPVSKINSHCPLMNTLIKILGVL